MNVTLTPERQILVEGKIESGRYRNAGEVVREALRLLEERDRRLDWLRSEVASADRQIARGEVVGLNRELIDQLSREATENSRAGKVVRRAIRP